MFVLTTALFLGFSSIAQISAQNTTDVDDLVGQLRLAPTQNDRFKILSDDTQFVFDFFSSAQAETQGAAGHTVAASSENFPAVIGNGIAMTVGFLGPCGMNTPHTHPRATEINFSVNGTLRTGMLTENGARFVVNNLPPGSMTIFPKGAIHFEVNDGCEPAMFVAGFNNEDPGVLQLAQRFFGLPPDIVSATLNDLGVEEIAGLENLMPDNIAFGTDECLARCGLTRATQPTLQRQPRVSGNALPSMASYTYSGPPPPASTAAAAGAAATTLANTASDASTSSASGPGDSSNVPQDNSFLSSNPSSSNTDNPFTDKSTQPIVIALIAINGVLVIGLVVFAVMWYRRGRQTGFNRPLHTSTLSPFPVTLGKREYRRTDNSDSESLTHDSSQGPYYDSHAAHTT